MITKLDKHDAEENIHVRDAMMAQNEVPNSDTAGVGPTHSDCARCCA